MVFRQRHLRSVSDRLAALLAGIVFAITTTAAPATDESSEAHQAMERPDSVPVDVWRTLVDVDRRVGDRKDFTASFVQHRHTPLLKKPMASSGRVLAKGSRMLWRTVKPRETSMLVTDDELRIHYPDQKVIEIYPIQRRVSQLAGSPQPRLATIVKHFRIEAGPIPDDATNVSDRMRLRLTPLDESMRQHIERIDLELDTEAAMTRRISYINPDEERTVVTFDDVQFNKGLTDDQLKLDIPPGTTVKRPPTGSEATADDSDDE